MAIGLLNTFTYNDLNSGNYGLYILNSNSYDRAERDLELISVPGRNGAIIQDNGRHHEIVIKYSVFLKRNDLNSSLAAIRSFLYQTIGGQKYSSGVYLTSMRMEYGVLYDDYSPNYYREAVFCGPADWETMLERYGKCDLEFLCKPEMYIRNISTKTITVGAGTTEVLFIAPPGNTGSNYLPLSPLQANGDFMLYPKIILQFSSYSTNNDFQAVRVIPRSASNQLNVSLLFKTANDFRSIPVIDSKEENVYQVNNNIKDYLNRLLVSSPTFPSGKFADGAYHPIYIKNETINNLVATLEVPQYTI